MGTESRGASGAHACLYQRDAEGLPERFQRRRSIGGPQQELSSRSPDTIECDIEGLYFDCHCGLTCGGHEAWRDLIDEVPQMVPRDVQPIRIDRPAWHDSVLA